MASDEARGSRTSPATAAAVPSHLTGATAPDAGAVCTITTTVDSGSTCIRVLSVYRSGRGTSYPSMGFSGRAVAPMPR